MTTNRIAGLTIESDDAVRIVRFDRPEAANAIDAGTHEALATIWGELVGQSGARCIVLTGTGRLFCSGGDLAWIESLHSSDAAQTHALEQDQRILAAIRDCPVPILAAVNGPAVGLGCSIAVSCDLVLLAQDAWLADPHVNIALAAGDGGAMMLPVLMPFMRAKQYLFTGDRIPAPLAVELGLAIAATAPERLLEETVQLAHRIARQPAAALRATKRAVNLHLSHHALQVAAWASQAEALSMRDPEFAVALEGLIAKLRARGATQ
ncbi:MAG: enoyl-CoA hydratase/isomerase family protein [Gammaproteobacteria bacterium]